MLIAVVTTVAIVCVLHLALTFALIRRIRFLQESIAAPEVELPKPGDPIGAFEATTPSGESITDAELHQRPTLVAFFRPHCPWCDKLLTQLTDSPPPLPMVAFVDGKADDPDASALLDRVAKVAKVAFSDREDSVHKTFRPAAYPTLVRVVDGKVAAAGHQMSDVLA